MKTRLLRINTLILAILLTPATARADFALSEFPQFVQDQGPTWIFELLYGILYTIFGLFLGDLFGIAS